MLCCPTRWPFSFLWQELCKTMALKRHGAWMVLLLAWLSHGTKGRCPEVARTERKKGAHPERLYTCWLPRNLPIFPSTALFFSPLHSHHIFYVRGEGGRGEGAGGIGDSEVTPVASPIKAHFHPLPSKHSTPFLIFFLPLTDWLAACWLVRWCWFWNDVSFALCSPSCLPESSASFNTKGDCDPTSKDCKSCKHCIIFL